MFGAFREMIISRATSGGRREIELNSGSLPTIPGGLATLAIVTRLSQKISLASPRLIDLTQGV